LISRRALLAAPLLAVPLRAEAAIPLAARPIDRLATGWWKARHEAKLAELRTARPGLIWLGDSITQNFERAGPEPWAQYQAVWQRFYAPMRAVNLGFKGDATCHLLWRLRHGEIAGIAPRAAVILIGANNLGRLHWSAEDSVAGIDAVVAETRRQLPNTRILLLGVLPSDRSAWTSEATATINATLAHRPALPGVTFQDVGALYMRNGALDHSLFYDPKLTPPEPALHPTAEGMAKLAATIAPTLARLMQA
jgi:lysophospholipase L1-like esterase